MVMVRGGRSFGGFSGGRSSSSNGDKKERSFMYTKSPSSTFTSGTSCASGVQGRRPREIVQIQHGRNALLDTPNRCQWIMGKLKEALQFQDNKIHLNEATVYNELFVNCPDVPDLRKLSEHDETDDPATKKHRCEALLELREQVLSQQYRELTASQNAFFNSWLNSNCPDDA